MAASREKKSERASRLRITHAVCRLRIYSLFSKRLPAAPSAERHFQCRAFRACDGSMWHLQGYETILACPSYALRREGRFKVRISLFMLAHCHPVIVIGLSRYRYWIVRVTGTFLCRPGMAAVMFNV